MDRSNPRGVTRAPIALTIAGSDSGAGAGIQADLRTFAAFGVYGGSVVTALTAQNTRGVGATHCAPLDIVASQMEAVLEDFLVASIKIGMLGSAEIALVVAQRLGRPSPQNLSAAPEQERAPVHLRERGRGTFIVYDPVMIATSGDPLSDLGFVDTVRERLLPLVDCLTPNLAEAAALLGEPLARSEDEMARQGSALLAVGPRAVLMKGGHLEGDEAVDLLIVPDGLRRFAAPRITSRNLHGTGCTLSSGIAASIVLGMALPEAAVAAKAFVGVAIENGREITLGAGTGPLIQAKLRAAR
jgi:hydroxymethylpyrimidine/phosphomethylpyrimidine kinase